MPRKNKKKGGKTNADDGSEPNTALPNHQSDNVNSNPFDFGDKLGVPNGNSARKDSRRISQSTQGEGRRKVSFVDFLHDQNQAQTDLQVKKVTAEQFMLNENLEEQSLKSSIAFFFKHSLRDIGRRKFHFSLAFCSVFIVVLSTLVINTAVEKGPIIFLRLAEGHQGEIDAFITPFGQYKMGTDQNNNLFINYTRIIEIFGKERFNLSPRKFVKAVQTVVEGNSGLYDKSDAKSRILWHETFDKQLNLPRRDDVYNARFDTPWGNNILTINTEQEKRIEIGREYKEQPIGFGQCYVTKKTELQATEGQIAIVKAPLTNLINQLIDKYNQQAIESGKTLVPADHEFLWAQVPCRIKFIESLYGKISPHSGPVITFEHDRFLELLSYYLPDPLHSSEYSNFQKFLRSPQLLDEFADQVAVTLKKPRASHYESPNIHIIRGKMSSYLAQIEEGLGFYPIQVESELLGDLSSYQMFVVFLGLIFDLIVMLLVIISILLIYSLLLINIETKSFEIGVQRMVGLSKSGLIAMVLVQSCIFVLPAVFFGFALSVPCLKIFSFVMVQKLHLEVQPIPSKTAIRQALFIGIFIPILSSIIPIRVALRKNLNDALDYQRSKTQGVFINVLQKGQKQMSGIIAFGTIACCYGVSIYYLLPLALISLNITLIMRIFIFILFGMLFALSLIALNSQRVIEILFTKLFLFFEATSVKVMVLKNLMAHRFRNKLTSIIYSLALGFVIFLIIAYKIQIETMRLHELRFRASYLQVQVELDQAPLKPKLIEPILRTQPYSEFIESFSWIPREIKNVENLKLRQSRMVDYSRATVQKVGIYGVTPSLFKSTHTELLEVDHHDQNTTLDIIEQLYTARGSQSVGMGSIIPKKTALNLSDYTQTLMIELQSKLTNRMYEVRPLFTMKMAPGFTMLDSDRLQFNDQAILMSLPMYASIGRLRIDEIPFERLIIKLKDHKNTDHIKQIKKALAQQLDSTGYNAKSYNIKDSLEDEKSLRDVELILQIIFSVIIPITMFLCFFSLSSSMSANLYEQCKELAILRAIGFQGYNVVRLYVYEAFILVTSSSVLGVMIGTFLGWIMALQQAMFLQLPFTFSFPLGSFIQIFTISVICAFLSTYGPTRSLISKPIPNIMRTA